MRGIIIRCEVLYFVTFRKPASTSLILTYPIPPFTTIRGMIANALGLGTHADCFIERVPYTFKENKGKYSVDYRIISIPKYMEPIKVSAIGYNFNGINVCLF